MVQIDRLDVKQWVEDRVTRAVIAHLISHFDFRNALLGMESNNCLSERLRGRAEVIEFISNIEDRL